MGLDALEGTIPPLVTPFDEGGSLDIAAFEANLESYAAEDLQGYLVLGSNGEAATLEEEEKLALVRSARARAGTRLLLVGTGLEGTRATCRFTRKVADLGADAVLVLTPHYYRSQMTPEVLERYYRTVADESPVPVLLYSVPSFTGLLFPPGLAGRLGDHPRIVGMKESSGDIALLSRILATAPPRFRVCCGSAPVAYPAFCLGARAAVIALACCAPRPAAALYRAVKDGNHARARALQEAVTPLATAVTSTYGIPGLKAAMTLAGRRGGHPRAPLGPAGPAVVEELRPLLARAEAAVEA
jgi:4-hydroxy-2-oxoglutarate aldolase